MGAEIVQGQLENMEPPGLEEMVVISIDVTVAK